MDFKRQPRQPEQPQNPQVSQQVPSQPVQGQYEPEQPGHTDRQFSSGVPQGPTPQSNHTSGSLKAVSPKKRLSKPLKIVISSILVLILLLVAAVGWYIFSLRPVNAQAEAKDFEIVSGSTPSMIGEGLKQSGIIRSSTAFMISARLQNVQGSLQAGLYSLSPADSTEQIIAKLAVGPKDTSVNITFLPGATVDDHEKVLVGAGYSQAQVDQALSKQYDHPLFA